MRGAVSMALAYNQVKGKKRTFSIVLNLVCFLAIAVSKSYITHYFVFELVDTICSLPNLAIPSSRGMQS